MNTTGIKIVRQWLLNPNNKFVENSSKDNSLTESNDDKEDFESWLAKENESFKSNRMQNIDNVQENSLDTNNDKIDKNVQENSNVNPLFDTKSLSDYLTQLRTSNSNKFQDLQSTVSPDSRYILNDSLATLNINFNKKYSRNRSKSSSSNLTLLNHFISRAIDKKPKRLNSLSYRISLKKSNISPKFIHNSLSSGNSENSNVFSLQSHITCQNYQDKLPSTPLQSLTESWVQRATKRNNINTALTTKAPMENFKRPLKLQYKESANIFRSNSFNLNQNLDTKFDQLFQNTAIKRTPSNKSSNMTKIPVPLFQHKIKQNDKKSNGTHGPISRSNLYHLLADNQIQKVITHQAGDTDSTSNKLFEHVCKDLRTSLDTTSLLVSSGDHLPSEKPIEMKRNIPSPSLTIVGVETGFQNASNVNKQTKQKQNKDKIEAMDTKTNQQMCEIITDQPNQKWLSDKSDQKKMKDSQERLTEEMQPTRTDMTNLYQLLQENLSFINHPTGSENLPTASPAVGLDSLNIQNSESFFDIDTISVFPDPHFEMVKRLSKGEYNFDGLDTMYLSPPTLMNSSAVLNDAQCKSSSNPVITSESMLNALPYFKKLWKMEPKTTNESNVKDPNYMHTISQSFDKMVQFHLPLSFHESKVKL